MMNVFSSRTQKWSLASIVLFFFVIVLGVFRSELFQAPISQSTEINRLRLLISPEEIESIHTLSLSNRLGEMKIEKSKSGKWQILEPRRIDARPEFVESILDHMSEFIIQSIHERDAINIANYSLENPEMEVEFQSHATGKLRKISLGLINTVDRSFYVSDSESNAIYLIKADFHILRTVKLTDIIDARIFTLGISDIQEFSLYQGLPTISKQKVHFFHKNGNWVTKNGSPLRASRVESFLNKLFALKSSQIIDNDATETKVAIAEYFNKPSFSIVVKTRTGEEISYGISALVRSIPGLKIEKRKYRLINSTDRDYPFLFSQDQTKFLWISTENLK